MRKIITGITFVATTLFASTAFAADDIRTLTIEDDVFNVNLTAMCDWENEQGTFPNGHDYWILTSTSGDIWIGADGSEIKFRGVCDIILPAVHVSGGGNGESRVFQDDGAAFRDKGKNGALGDGERRDQAGGTTTGGNGAPPAVGG